MGIYKFERNLIGINGLIGSGKDTVTGMIQDHSLHREKKFANVKFATKLKQICGLLVGVDPINFEDQDFKKKSLPPIWEFYKIQMDYVTMEPVKLKGKHAVASKTVTKTKVFDRMPEGRAIRTLDDVEIMKEYLIKQYPSLVELRGVKVAYTYREMLQYIGTELLRNQFHPDVHVMATFADYVKQTVSWDEEGNSQYEVYPNWIISDTRFKNEAEFIKSKGGLVIRVERYGMDDTFVCKNEHPGKVFKVNYWDDCGVVGMAEDGTDGFFDYKDIRRFNPGSHESERELDTYDFDHIIYNVSDLKTLGRKVDEFVKTKMWTEMPELLEIKSEKHAHI